jgi:hypothetical protein
MNWLVYKSDAQYHTTTDSDATFSQSLFDKLNLAETDTKSVDTEVRNAIAKSKRSLASGAKSAMSKISLGTCRSSMSVGEGVAYGEWLKKKDAEKRLKRKLIRQAQDQVRESLLGMA